MNNVDNVTLKAAGSNEDKSGEPFRRNCEHFYISAVRLRQDSEIVIFINDVS